MTIKRMSVFSTFGLIILLALLGLIAFKVLLLEFKNHQEGQDRLLQAYQLAEHIRQTSDDLTRMARTYVSTGDKAYKENYYQILNIRSGKEIRPENHDSTLWYLGFDPETRRLTNVKYGKPQSLKSLMIAIGLKQKEIEELYKSIDRSNALVHLEEKAFKVLEGLCDDGTGNYTIECRSDKELATKLLFSPEYHQAKKEIMEPIQAFLSLVKQNTQQSMKDIRDEEIIYIELGIGIIVLSIIGISIFVLFVRKLVLVPLQDLYSTSQKLASGEQRTRATVSTNNELGALGTCFNKMADRLESKIEELEYISSTDELTGILNRRAFFKFLEYEINQSKRNLTPLALLMMDIDHFKKVNDTYGHQFGDEVLKQICHVCENNIREVDTFGRIGGEEFIVLMPETTLEQAENLAERIRQNIEKTSIEYEGLSIYVTISIGLTEYIRDETVSKLMSRVDTALYTSKENGRNRVTVLEKG